MGDLTTTPQPPGMPRVVAHDFPIRRDLTVRLVLPVDLTSTDAERVAEFVRSLAFPGGAA